MKKLFLSLLMAMIAFVASAQNIGEAFYIYRNDGGFNAFFRDEVDSIAYSNYDADSIWYDDVVTQVVYTPDSTYCIPLAVIDSVGFVQPETKYSDDAIPLTGSLFDYLVASDSLNLTFDSSIPSDLLPKVGNKIVATDLTEKLPLGFTGIVRQVELGTDGYVVFCDSLALEEVVDCFYGVVEMTGQRSDGSKRRYLRRNANSEHGYMTFNLVIPTINRKLDLTPIVIPKDIYDINGKAEASTVINPVITGRITRVVDKVLHISHYNIHAVTDVATVTTVEVAGEATNSDNPFNQSNLEKDFTIEGTKPGPYGIPIYYAFGPKFELSGEIALGTTVYANFKHTEDINYNPLTAAFGLVVPGLTPVHHLINIVNGSTALTYFNVDWAYIAGKISARIAVVGRLGIGIAAEGHNLGWVGGEAQIGAKADAELGFDFEDLSNAEKGTGFYDGLKDKSKVEVMPFWGLEGKLALFDDRIKFTFIGRDDFSFWGKKWEWDFLPKFSDTKATVKNKSNALVTANITNDCIIPYTVGVSLFDENNKRIGEPQWYKQKYWNHNSFSLPFETTFTDLTTGKKYKAYPTLRLFGFNVLASPSADVELEFPVEITNFKVTKSEHKEDGFYHNGSYYDYAYYAATTVVLKESEGIADWGYVYEDPNGQTTRISLKAFGSPHTDTRYAYYRDSAHDHACLYEYVQYEGDSEYYYGEKKTYNLDYEGEHSCPDSNHPHWIDLGLPSGTLWRCCNEGASTPEDYGGYYTYGQVSSAPTLEQIQELLRNCSYQWTTQNGVAGGKFTGPNGGTIFLPAAGGRWSGELFDVGSVGYYWSSTPYGEYLAYGLGFNSYYASWYYDNRDLEYSVRPVR